MIRIEHADGAYKILQGADHWVPRADMVVPWLRGFAIEGLDTVNKARKDYAK
jgi:hypothetical protein